jgi:hypothetical protein
MNINGINRKLFNETAAVAFFTSSEGLEYGYKTLLWGWLDTISSNFPCLPPDYSSNCMQAFLFCLFIYLLVNSLEKLVGAL